MMLASILNSMKMMSIKPLQLTCFVRNHGEETKVITIESSSFDINGAAMKQSFNNGDDIYNACNYNGDTGSYDINLAFISGEIGSKQLGSRLVQRPINLHPPPNPPPLRDKSLHDATTPPDCYSNQAELIVLIASSNDPTNHIPIHLMQHPLDLVQRSITFSSQIGNDDFKFGKCCTRFTHYDYVRTYPTSTYSTSTPSR